jgi:hypothetical protein
MGPVPHVLSGRGGYSFNQNTQARVDRSTSCLFTDSFLMMGYETVNVG